MKNEAPPCPTEPTEVEVDWLSWHLREAGILGNATIERIDCEPMGDSVGFLSRMVRIVLEYADSGPLPSLILKLDTNRENFRQVANRLRAFDREVGFYQHMAPHVPTRLPQVYASRAAGGGGWLLMEDLTRLNQGCQIHGLSNSQVRLSLSHMAAVHAASWEDPQLVNHRWLPDHDFWFREDVSAIWPSFREHYGLRIGTEATKLIERILERVDLIDSEIAARPRTLVHGDLRADNLLLGEPGSDDEVLILDWQTVTRSLAAIDVAMIIGGSDPPAERAGHYHELYSGWLAAMERHGVQGYSGEHAQRDLRLALLSCLRIPLKVFHELGGPSFRNAREAQLADVFILRHASAAVECEAGLAMP